MDYPRAVKLSAGITLLGASLLLYLYYQQVESLTPGALSIAAFGVGSYCVVSEIGPLKSLGRVLPFMVVGASCSLGMVTMGFSSAIAGSYYASAMSFLSVRLTSFIFSLDGVRVPVSGDVLLFPNGTALSVGPLCSGAYSTVLFMLLSIVMVTDLSRAAPKKKLAVAVAVGLFGANFANLLRISFLASIMYLFGLNALDVVHQFAGYAVFLGFMTAFWMLSLKWLVPPRT